MSKSRTLFVSLVASGSVAVLAAQLALPSLLTAHIKSLTEAQALTGVLNVQPIPGSPREVKFSYSRPNFLKVESEDGFTLSDGKNIYTYVKSTNKYTVEAISEANLNKAAGLTDVWALAAFFNKEAFKDATAKLGNSRTIKGNKVKEILVEWQKPTVGSATIYVDEATSLVRGWNVKDGDTMTVVLAENLEIKREALDASTFAFAAPVGATKVEVMEEPKAGYAKVQSIFNKACMPCHNSDNRKDGIDLSSYDAIMGSQGAVVAGDPDQSLVIKTTKGSRASMPKNRAPLSASEIQVISDWIKEGAKKA